MSHTGVRIKRARKHRKIEIKDAVKELHKSESTLFRWEKEGIRDAELLLTLAKYYECSYIWLAFDIGSPHFNLSHLLGLEIEDFWVKEGIFLVSNTPKDR